MVDTHLDRVFIVLDNISGHFVIDHLFDIQDVEKVGHAKGDQFIRVPPIDRNDTQGLDPFQDCKLLRKLGVDPVCPMVALEGSSKYLTIAFASE
jgi:hypothetical protein